MKCHHIITVSLFPFLYKKLKVKNSITKMSNVYKCGKMFILKLSKEKSIHPEL